MKSIKRTHLSQIDIQINEYQELSEFVDLGKMKTPQNHVLANIVTS
jgi:hypothetical protein